MTGTALVERDAPELSPFKRIESVFDEQDKQAIAQFINVSPDDKAFVPFLAIAASYGLDPIAGEIWLIPRKGKNGQVTGHKPAAGRDGFLKHALRDPNFLGIEGDVVCANDTFESVYENGERHIKHVVALGPTLAGDKGEARAWRGPIMGAWAEVHRRDKRPQYFFAPFHEHAKDPAYSAWNYASAMILKSAMSMALRLTYSISGIVPVDEISGDAAIEPGEQREAIDVAPIEAIVTVEGNPELQERIRTAVQRANDREPGAYSGAKLNMLIAGRDDEALTAFAAEVEAENTMREQRVAEAAAKAAEQPEAVQDADVVPDLSPEQAERVEGLEHQVADLQLAIEDLPPGDEARTQMEHDLANIEAEIDSLRSGEQSE